MQLSSAECIPETAIPLIEAFCSEHVRHFGERLIGIYLYGSRTRAETGKNSDYDFVFALERPIETESREHLKAIHDRICLPLDSTYLTRSELAQDVAPTPVQFVIRSTKATRLYRCPSGYVDFPLIRQDVHLHGQTLYGVDKTDLFPPVSRELLERTLHLALPAILERGMLPAIQLTRVLYSHALNDICSKRKAASWAEANVPPRWRDLVRKDLVEYVSGESAKHSTEDLQGFYEYCRSVVSGEIGDTGQ